MIGVEMFPPATNVHKNSLAEIAAVIEESAAATNVNKNSLSGIATAIEEPATEEPAAAIMAQDSLAASMATDEGLEVSRQSGRSARCVRFADDYSQCLETVRVMTAPSDYPPKINPGKGQCFMIHSCLYSYPFSSRTHLV